MRKLFPYICILFLVVFLAPREAEAGEKRYDIPLGNSPSIGSQDAPVVIVEFVDYQ